MQERLQIKRYNYVFGKYHNKELEETMYGSRVVIPAIEKDKEIPEVA